MYVARILAPPSLHLYTPAGLTDLSLPHPVTLHNLSLHSYTLSHPQVQAGVQKLSVGRPEDNADITPVVSSSSADFITSLVEDAQAKGATFLTPYKRCVCVSV